ncbi:MAG TPA: non-heme iron oxygenase ferredoxin subunit [Candidatus Thermoplasmatota archaeon]|jgi:nitrite reductase/ring-hydroxylating ferredoxin subunit|nr:non-heme iron oxygenase ferredoxin subunit [Candidatus Thermoplasmatota archaeon]
MKLAVCDVDELPPGTMRGALADPSDPDTRVVVANVGGELRAFSGVCTHAYAELDQGFLRDGRVMCPLHFSEFDSATGEPLSPPAVDPIPCYPVAVEDGRVVVDIPGMRTQSPNSAAGDG